MKIQILPFIILMLSISYNSISQVPDAFSYQAVVRNSDGDVISDQQVSFKISIVKGDINGQTIYSEAHDYTTNEFGLANLKIGMGDILSGTFNPGVWGGDIYFIKVELDPDGDGIYIHMGTTQLLSVPFASRAKTVEIDMVDDSDADPGNEIQEMTLTGSVLNLSKNGGSVNLPTGGNADNWGTQSVVSDVTLDGNGLQTDRLRIGQQGATLGQILMWNGTNWSPGMNDDNPTNEIQQLSILGDQLSLSAANTVTLPTGTGSQWLDDGDNIYFNTGKVGIGTIPGADLRQFQSMGENMQAIAAENNSSVFPALFARNNGTGLSAEFRNAIKIQDGTHGMGKVLTSDAQGISSWEDPPEGSLWSENGSDIYYDAGNVGIGINDPSMNLSIFDSTFASLNLLTSDSGNSSTDGFSINFYNATNIAEFKNHEVGGFGDIRFVTDGTALIISNDGQVGIKTDPDYDLDVNGTSYFKETMFIEGDVSHYDTGGGHALPIGFGQVSASGTISDNTFYVDGMKESTGKYKITMHNLSSTADCIITATPMSTSPRFATIQRQNGNNYFYVYTYNTSGTLTDAAFMFTVFEL